MSTLLIRSKADVADFVNGHQMSKASKWIVLIALGGVFVDAYDFASLGIGVPGLMQEFQLSPVALGSLAAVMGFGALIGGVVGGYFTDKIGRYRMFLLDLTCLVLATLGAALSPNIYCLIFFRFLMGLGVGLDYPVAFSFIAEFVNSKRKGGAISLWVFLWQVAVACSVIVALCFYFLGAGPYLWRLAIGFGALPALAVLLLRGKYMWESPMWAASYVGLEEAARLLEKTYGVKVILDPSALIRAPKPRVSYWTIFSAPYLSRTLVVSVVCVTQSLEYFAVGFYLPSISQEIFGKEFVFAAIGTLISTIAGVIGGLSAASLVDRLGARRLIAAGYAIIIISLVSFWYTAGRISPYWSVLLIYLFIFGQTLGPGSLCASIAALAYPTSIRGTGTGWSQGMIRLGTILGFYFFPVILAQIGLNQLMLLLAVVPLIGLAAILCTAWEPIGSDPDVEESTAATRVPLTGVPELQR